MNDYKTVMFEMLVEAEMKKSAATQALAKFLDPQQMLSDLEKEMKKLAAEDEKIEEDLAAAAETAATAAGFVISLPKMVQWIGEVLGWITNKIRTLRSKNKLERNVIVDFAHAWHDLYIVAIKWLLKLRFGKKLPDDEAKKLAKRIFYIIVAGLFLSSGYSTVKAIIKGDAILAGVEGAMASIKGAKLGTYLAEILSGLNLVGTAGTAADAAEVADVIDDAVEIKDLFTGDLKEMSAMSLGAVEVGAGKTKDNLGENKLRITKGRLRQILAEEVARHQKQKLNFKMMKEEMGAAEEEAEASELRAEEEPGSVVNEKKMTDKHDAEMKEKGFSAKQAKNLPDELQKSMLKEYEEVLVLKGDQLVIVDDEGNEKVMGDKLDAEEYGLYKDGDSTVVSMGFDNRNYGRYGRGSGYGRYGSSYRRYEESVIKEEVHKVLKQILKKK